MWTTLLGSKYYQFKHLSCFCSTLQSVHQVFCPSDSSYRSPKHGEAWFELQTKIATFFSQLSFFFDKMANKLHNIKSCTGFFLNNLKWTFITWSVRYTSDSQNFGNFSICSSKPDNFSLLKSLFWLNNEVINKCLCQYLQDLRNSVNYFPNFPCQIPQDHSWVERPILARLGDRSSKRDTDASHEPRDCRQWDNSQAVTANMHPKCVTIHRF